MIRSFKHRGLKRFYETESKAGIDAKHVGGLKIILARLDASIRPEDMKLPGFGFHPLKGKRKGTYAVKVSGNWRVTFRWEGADAVDVDYEDCH